MRVEWTHNKVTKDITEYVTSLKWSGAATQASRTLEFSLANDPYDKYLKRPDIKTGDVLKLYKGKDKNPKFVGRAVTRQLTSEIGTVDVTVYDYMHNMIQSTGTYKFNNKSPEYIAKSVLSDLKITPGDLMKTNTKIKKYYPSDRTYYDIVMGAYKKVSKKTGKKYFPRMNGTKFEIIEKGKIVKNYVLRDDANIYESRYEENADGIVNMVDAYKDDKKVGTYKKNDSIKKYGVVRQSVDVESGKGSTEAKNTFQGVEKTASVSAIGNWDCIAGRGIQIYDSSSKLIGTYWIENDTHTFEGGVHKMELDLTFKNVMEDPQVKNERPQSKTVSNSTTVRDTTNTSVVSSNAGGTKYITSTGNAVFTASFITPGAMDDYGHVLKENTIIAPKSFMLGGTVKVSGTGTKYDGRTLKIVKRMDNSFVDGKTHYSIPMKSESDYKSFGKKYGTAKYTRGVTVKGTTSKAEQVVRVANSYQGKVKYKVGASTPASGTCGNPEFVYVSFFRGAGVNVGSSAGAQALAGSLVLKQNLRRGDIVVFRNTDGITGISHTGIMLNNKQFIHCAIRGVVVDTLQSDYWSAHYVRGRRIV